MPPVVVETGGTDWLTPLATLLAVVVGGVLSWLTQSRLAERSARLQQKANADADEWLLETEARAAARVLQSDFSAAASRLVGIVERQRWLSFYTMAPASWGTGQASLAKRLDPAAWSEVADVVMQLRAIDDLMRAAVAPGGPQAGASSVELIPATIKRLESVWRGTMEAYNLLADVAGTARR